MMMMMTMISARTVIVSVKYLQEITFQNMMTNKSK